MKVTIQKDGNYKYWDGKKYVSKFLIHGTEIDTRGRPIEETPVINVDSLGTIKFLLKDLNSKELFEIQKHIDKLLTSKRED